MDSKTNMHTIPIIAEKNNNTRSNCNFMWMDLIVYDCLNHLVSAPLLEPVMVV